MLYLRDYILRQRDRERAVSEQSAFITNNPYKKTTKQTEYSNYKENQKNTNKHKKKAIFHIKQHKTK